MPQFRALSRKPHNDTAPQPGDICNTINLPSGWGIGFVPPRKTWVKIDTTIERAWHNGKTVSFTIKGYWSKDSAENP